MQPKVARVLVLCPLFVAIGLFVAAPSALAYGSADQWQAGFSGTCSSQSSCPFGPVPQQGAFGFWGWCAFGGSNGSSSVGTTGTTADCQVTTYFGPGSTFHIKYDVTGWIIQATSPLTGGLPDFLFQTGTIELSGPGAPGPTGIPIPIPPAPFCPLVVCDSGIPAIPGHFSLHSPGAELNVQVTKLP